MSNVTGDKIDLDVRKWNIARSALAAKIRQPVVSSVPFPAIKVCFVTRYSRIIVESIQRKLVIVTPLGTAKKCHCKQMV